MIRCARCAAKPSNPDARFCSKCGSTLTRPHWIATSIRLLALPLILVGRALTYPIKLRRERTRWLTEASRSSPDSPVNQVPGLSPGARRVYSYLASVTLRFGASHSRIRTIARVSGLSEHKARAAIRELERKGLLSHHVRNTWHGRGAHSYRVRPVRSGN